MKPAIFSACGVTIDSDLEPPVVVPAAHVPDVYVRHQPDLTFGGPASLSTWLLNPDGGGVYQVFPESNAIGLRVPPVADFYCTDRRIGYRPLSRLSRESLLWQLFGTVFTVWLERRGAVVLHAAAVELAGEAVGFLGRAGAGKSSLAAAFMKRGYRLLGDDHLIVEPGTRPLRVVPALPWLKVLPATARWLGRDPETLPFLHPNSCKRRFDLPFDSIARNSLPLRRLYVLRRSADAARPTVRPLVAAEAMAAVIRHSYLPRTMAAARLDVGRLATLAQMCDQGVAELTYPDGWEAIGDAISAVTDEI